MKHFNLLALSIFALLTETFASRPIEVEPPVNAFAEVAVVSQESISNGKRQFRPFK